MVQSESVKNLFDVLIAEKIPYLVLSSYDDINGTEGDIDLFVPEESKTRFLQVLIRCGWLERREPPEYTFHNFFYKIVPPHLIALDVKFDLVFGAEPHRILKAREPERIMHDAQEDSNGFIRPHGYDLLLLYLAHLICEKKKFTSKHLTQFQKYWESYQHEIPSTLESSQGLFTITQTHDLIQAHSEAEKIFKTYFHDIGPAERFRYKNKKPSKEYRILFIGADGSGKTTLVESISHRLNVKSSKLYLGEREWAFALIGMLYNKIHVRILRTIVIYTLYPFDLLFRRIRTQQRGTRVVLIDRVPGFPFISGGRIEKIFRLAIGRIDFIIHLTGDPEKLFARKREGTVIKTRHNIEKWERVYRAWHVPSLSIDTTQTSLDEIERMCLTAVITEASFQSTFFRPITLLS